MDDDKELKWKIESVQPLTEIELKYLKLDEVFIILFTHTFVIRSISIYQNCFQANPDIIPEEEEKWILVRPVIREPKESEYMITHVLKGLSPGKYAARIRSRNSHGWSIISEPLIFDGGDISLSFQDSYRTSMIF